MTGLIAAFFTAALSGMGVGGGGLLLIYLTLCENVPQHSAQLTNLCFFMTASVSSLLVHLKKRRLPFAAILLLAVGGVLGAAAGSLTAAQTEPKLLRIFLGVFFAASGLYSLFRKQK